MELKNKIEKMFVVLVAGGTIMAHAGETGRLQIEEKSDNPVTFCSLELHQKRLGTSNKVTCLDDIKDEEHLLQIIEDSRAQCLTPFCGCWLG